LVGYFAGHFGARMAVQHMKQSIKEEIDQGTIILAVRTAIGGWKKANIVCLIKKLIIFDWFLFMLFLPVTHE